MNVTVTKVKPKSTFEPVVVSIEITTYHQMANLLSRLGVSMDRNEIIGALPQYGNWRSTPINDNKYIHIANQPFTDVMNEIGNQLKWRIK